MDYAPNITLYINGLECIIQFSYRIQNYILPDYAMKV